MLSRQQRPLATVISPQPAHARLGFVAESCSASERQSSFLVPVIRECQSNRKKMTAAMRAMRAATADEGRAARSRRLHNVDPQLDDGVQRIHGRPVLRLQTKEP